MNTLVTKLNELFSKFTNYNFINKINEKQLRNIENGISLSDVFFYCFQYTKQSTTKEFITSKINNTDNKIFTRHAYENKGNNISLEVYNEIFANIITIYNSLCEPIQKQKLVAVDGTNNLDNKNNIMLNMVYYDITNDIPIDITYNGHENRNKEVKCLLEDIINNSEKYKNVILIGDRCYFTYKLLNTLIEKNINFVIRIKGKGKYIEKNLHNPDKIRIVKCLSHIDKIIYPSSRKKHITKTRKITLNNDCLIITNLDNSYIDSKIINFYRSRWEIETFIKFVKYNFKFAELDEKNIVKHKKMYMCELIITYIMNLLIHYINFDIKNTNESVSKINKSNIISGLYDSLLYDIVHCKLTKDKLDIFCNSYIKIYTNKTNRTFERKSKRPHKKWSNKGYSDMSKYERICDAIENKCIDTLHKNLKMIARRIIKLITISISNSSDCFKK